MSDAQPATGLRANVRLDLATAALAMPSGRLVIPLVAVGIAAGFGFIRPGYESSYGESLLLIVFLSAVGALGRTLGTAAVIAFGAADFARFLIGADKFVPFPTAQDAIGRVVTYAVLWLLVAYVPSVARRVEWAAETRRNGGLLGRLLASAIGAGVAGLGTYLWANVMPYLFRTAYPYTPPPATLQPQQHPELLALGVAAAYFLVVVFVRRGPVNPVELAPLTSAPQRTGILGLIARVIGYAAVLLVLSGMFYAAFDAAIIIAGFVVAEVGAWVAGRFGLGGLGRSRSANVIAAGGAVLSIVALLVISWVANAIWPQGLYIQSGLLGRVQSNFWPILLAMAVAWPIARIAFSLAARARRVGNGSAGVGGPAVGVAEASTTIGAALAAALLGGGVLLAMLLMPAVAFADNCGNLSDCFYTALFLGVMFWFGLPLLTAANFLSPPTAPDSVPSKDPRLKNFGQKDDKPTGFSDRFNNVKRGGSDFFGGGGY